MRYLMIAMLALFLGACATTESKVVETESPKVEVYKSTESFDTVAYFTVQKAIKGLPQFSLVHDGVKYIFSSKENRDEFEQNPEKYIPGYEAYCPVSLANGSNVKGKPTVWRVYKDKLYWFFSEKHADEFDENEEEILKKAEENSKK